MDKRIPGMIFEESIFSDYFQYTAMFRHNPADYASHDHSIGFAIYFLRILYCKTA